ncbi:hypothetical protein CR513_10486, partial [Mucuna pruriens]
MAYTTSEDEDDEEVNFNYLEYLLVAYEELLSNFSTLSLGYKELKIKFSKLSKDFEILEKENSILKKENEKLKEEQTNDLDKAITSKISELQKEIIDFRQSLAKFINGTKNLNKLLKYNTNPHYKSSLEYPKGMSKPSRTNPKGPKKFWVPKIMIIHVAYVFKSKKETLVMVPGQWVLTSHDGRKVYVSKSQDKEKRMGYLRRIEHNLLSISQLCDSGYDVSFNKEKCIVRDYNDSIIFSVKRQNNLYKIDLTNLTNQNVTSLVSINDYQWTWYKKFGHASLRLISKLKKHNLVRESKNIVSTSKPLKLLHIILFAPIITTSLGGKYYGLVMFLAHKDESFKGFSVFYKCIQIEKLFILPLSKVIMRENFKMKTFNSFVKNKEFIIIFLVQEFLNIMKLLIQLVICKTKNIYKTHFEKRLPMNYKKVDNLTFLISTISNDNLGKFDPKSDKRSFIGCLIVSKAYRVYNSRSLKVEESINLNIKDLHTAPKESLLDYEPKIDEASSRNLSLGTLKIESKLGQPLKTKLKWLCSQKLNPRM